MRAVIDRFEGDYAVCEKEDKEMVKIDKNILPLGAKEGDVLRILGEDILIDLEATEKEKKTIEEMTKNLWN